MKNLKWMPKYEINVNQLQKHNKLSIMVEEYDTTWDINKQFQTIVSERKIRIVPRFLFGISTETIEQIYGDKTGKEYLVSRLPIAGVFTNSTLYDRIIIQIFIYFVTMLLPIPFMIQAKKAGCPTI